MRSNPQSQRDALRLLRDELGGLSQERFARKLGVTLRTVSRWEGGDSLSPRILVQLYGVANEVGALNVAGWFKRKARDVLKLEPEETLSAGLVARTPAEHALVSEFLRRYRDHDAALEPFVEKLLGSRAANVIREYESENGCCYADAFSRELTKAIRGGE